jgi:hypothetical protein
MTIPGRGDLSPRRHHGGYGRRRRRWPRVLLVLVVLGALGAGGYYGWHRWRDNSTDTVALAPCPTSTPTPSAPPPSITARVLNGSLKAGLAAKVAKQLHERFGVSVAKVGNAARFTRGASIVRYPPPLAVQARSLAGYVTPRAQLRADAKLRKVELDIGTAFRAVAPAPVISTPMPSRSPLPCTSP